VTVGTRSLLIGVHQVVWHPLTVAVAWRRLYGRWPSWREALCILWHDWGYLGAREMDGPDGERHVELGARLAAGWLGREWGLFCLLHSRHYARLVGREPSPLCWADKASIGCERWWTYLPRARLSGELAEYRAMAAADGAVPAAASDRDWFAFIQDYFRQRSVTRTIGPYVNPRRDAA
jgi:hypothetical protein